MMWMFESSKPIFVKLASSQWYRPFKKSRKSDMAFGSICVQENRRKGVV